MKKLETFINVLYSMAKIQIVGFIMFEIAHHQATLTRGYNAIGGEIFFLFLPVIVWISKEMYHDFKDTMANLKGDK